MKRRYFARMIHRHRFDTDEPEYAQLPNLVTNGDWVLDVGANVGAYTLRLSELVGTSGRVISFEPVPKTFELLAANAALCSESNITLINGAASDAPGVVGMEIPKFDTGLDNFYMAKLSSQLTGLQVLPDYRFPIASPLDPAR